MRHIAIAGLGACILAVAPMVTVAQAPDDAGVGTGGRAEVVTAGYALTLPDDWAYIQPTGADASAIIAEVERMWPDLAVTIEAALESGLGFSLLAFGPDPNPVFAENCNVLDRRANESSIDAIATDEFVKLDAFRDVLASGPELTFVELPTGRAGRLDLGLTLPTFDTASTSYLMTDGVWLHTLTCTDLERPTDAWLGIAQGFEFLPSSP